MRRLAIVSAVALALVSLSGILQADPEGLDVGATVIHEGICGLGVYGLTEDMQAVVTPSGNVKLTCHGQITDPLLLPDKAVKIVGELCGLPDGTFTNDMKLVATPGGQVTLVCMSKSDPNP